MEFATIKSKAEWTELLKDYIAAYKLREKYIEKVGFPIYTKEVLELLTVFIGNHTVVDVGCGTGFLASKLMEKGLKVTPIDSFETEYGFYIDANKSFAGNRFCDIVEADATSYPIGDFDIVVMSWPDYCSDFGEKVLDNMRLGQTLIYQGEGLGGCTGDDEMHYLLVEKFIPADNLNWKLHNAHISFPGIHDCWSVYKKLRK